MQHRCSILGLLLPFVHKKVPRQLQGSMGLQGFMHTVAFKSFCALPKAQRPDVLGTSILAVGQLLNMKISGTHCAIGEQTFAILKCTFASFCSREHLSANKYHHRKLIKNQLSLCQMLPQELLSQPKMGLWHIVTILRMLPWFAAIFYAFPSCPPFPF